MQCAIPLAFNRLSSATRAEAGLSIFQVMPRNMHFGASGASSIDLCVRDLVSASRFRETTKIFAEKCEDYFPGFNLDWLPHAAYSSTAARARHIARVALREQPDVIIVQQHLPTAAAIARWLPHCKVILYRHNFQKCRHGYSLRSFLHRVTVRRRYARLAGIIHVSHAAANAFTADWPDIKAPICIVHNGFDFDSWHPARHRSKEVLCVARCVPEKGVLEAAFGVAAVLPRFPDWRARFILSNVNDQPAYFQNVQAVLSGLGAQAIIEGPLPFAEVKAATERAAISIVPSVYLEPFGRTALEAHAGGTALISSGRGGLTEVSGETAMLLDTVTDQTIANAIEALISNNALRQQLAHAGRERVRTRFDIKHQAARMDAFCCSVASGAHLDTCGHELARPRALREVKT